MFHSGRYKEALVLIEEKENTGSGRSDIGPLQVAIHLALGDSMKANYYFHQCLSEDSLNLSNVLNDISYRMELDGQAPDLALKLTNLAISAAPGSPYPYSTRAELLGINGDSKGFYENLEKALKLGFPVLPLTSPNQPEPYRNHQLEERDRKSTRLNSSHRT